MQVDSEQMKKVIRAWLERLRKIETDFMVYWQVIELLKPSDPALVDSLLEKTSAVTQNRPMRVT